MLDRLVQHAEELVSLFNEAVAGPLDADARWREEHAPDDGQDGASPARCALDPAAERARCAPRLQVRLHFLVDQATAKTLEDQGEDEAAHRLMERHLRDA